MLDEIDQKIIYELRKNSRIPISELAIKAGRSRTAIETRITKLEEKGVISGYTIIEKGCHQKDDIGAIILVSLKARNKSEFFLNAIKNMPEIYACYDVSGSCDFTILLKNTKNTNDLHIVLEKIYNLDDIKNTETLLTLYKRV